VTLREHRVGSHRPDRDDQVLGRPVRDRRQRRVVGGLQARVLGREEYAADLNEVESLGAINSTTRTPEQTHAAAFWQTNPSTTENAVARRFVDQFSLDVSDSARLFALLDLSMADTIITTWHDK
jgi:hypothetical protein